MRRTLSSPLTVFWKFVNPVLLAGGLCTIVVMHWQGKFLTALSTSGLILFVIACSVPAAGPLYRGLRQPDGK